MTDSKIHPDEVDWLISVYCDSDDDELKNEAYEKLTNFGLDEKQIKERFKNLNSEEKQIKAFEKAWEKQAERNKFVKYTLLEQITIFLLGPIELFRHYNSGLKELKESNYRILYRQRLILLISGTIFWILFCISSYKYSEYKRMKEIEEVDITEWENNRIKN